MTKIIHVVEEFFDVIASGVTTVVGDMHHQLLNAALQSDIISVTSGQPKNEFEHQSYFKNGLWRYTNTLAHQLEEELKSRETIIHTHGIWMYPQFIANILARKHHHPYIVSTHGMLEPWVFNKGRLKKKIYFSLMQKQNIDNASILHAITPIERDNLFAITGKKNIEIIPNFISTGFTENLKLSEKTDETRYILFVGRLHPIKGIELLLKAFAKLPDKNIILKIIGPKNDYYLLLKELAKNLAIFHRVEFMGLIKGDEKYRLYRDALAFVAPSYCEMIGMVNLEAGLMSTPVITTFQTGILAGWNEHGGILINPDIEELYHALNSAVSWGDIERNDRGKTLKKYIIDNYSWEKNLHKWVNLYTSIAFQ